VVLDFGKIRHELLELEKEEKRLKSQHTSWLLNPDGSLVDWRDEAQVRAKVYAQWDENWNQQLNEMALKIGKRKAAKPESA
jgi:hypothetical protein